jgi:hypothetical protein
MTTPQGSRREFVKRGVYMAPAILTLAAAPEFAKAGSYKEPEPPKGGGRGRDDDDRGGHGNKGGGKGRH